MMHVTTDVRLEGRGQQPETSELFDHVVLDDGEVFVANSERLVEGHDGIGSVFDQLLESIRQMGWNAGVVRLEVTLDPSAHGQNSIDLTLDED
jgi:hypothetical protein